MRFKAPNASACLPLCGMLLGVPGVAESAPVPQKPNIVLILADDMGWQDAGFSGTDFNETPVLDRLAKAGMIFRHAYAPAANCAPSRACLLSGQYTPRHGVFAVGTTNRGPEELMRLRPVPNRGGLAPGDFTLAKALKAAGYSTGMFGKWHLDGSGGSRPGDQGFDAVAVDGHSWSANTPEDPKGVYSIASAANEFIEANKDRPFFLYLPHYAVHSPLQSTSGTLEKFRDRKPGAMHSDAKYAASLFDFDHSVGIVLDKLDELGLRDNTLVVFTSDNGGTFGSQEPMRGKKGCYYEGGVREPMAVRWPAVVKPGSTCDVPVISVDFYPTFLDVAGARPPPDRPLDGESLLPLLEGGNSLHRQAIFWHFPGYLNGPVPRGRDPVFRTRPVSVVRKGDWKLFLYHEEWLLDGGRKKLDSNSAVELYNLAEDPGEQTDLALTQTDKRDELLGELLAWIDKTKAPLPTVLEKK